MKIHNITGPSLISQVGSISTFGSMLQFHIFFFFLLFSDLCVRSVQSRQKVKLNNANVHSSITESARKRERECYKYVCVQFSVGLCQCIHVLVCVCSPRGAYLCHSRMCRWGVGGSVCVLVCRRPWMLSRLQLGTAVVHVQCRKEQEQATYKLNCHTLKTSTFALASSSMSSRAMKWAIDTCIMLGCQSEQEVQGIFRFI